MSVGGTSSRLAFLRAEERREGLERAAIILLISEYQHVSVPSYLFCQILEQSDHRRDGGVENPGTTGRTKGDFSPKTKECCITNPPTMYRASPISTSTITSRLHCLLDSEASYSMLWVSFYT